MRKFFEGNDWIVKFTNLTVTPKDETLLTPDGITYLVAPNADFNIINKSLLTILQKLREEFPDVLEGFKLVLPCGNYDKNGSTLTSLGILYAALYKHMGLPYVLWCNENGILKNKNCPDSIKTATTYGMPISHYFSNLLIESVLQHNLGGFSALCARRVVPQIKVRASRELYKVQFLKAIELLYMLVEMYVNSVPSDTMRTIKELFLNPIDPRSIVIGWDVEGDHSSLLSLCCGSRLICQVSVASPSRRMSYRTFISEFAKGASYIHSNLKEEIQY